MTPPKQLSDTDDKLEAVAERAGARGAREAMGSEMSESHRARQLLRWDMCKKDGPVGELRRELAYQHTQREKAMKRAIMVATFAVTAVTAGIQMWGKLSDRAAANAELVRAITELRSEVKTATERGK